MKPKSNMIKFAITVLTISVLSLGCATTKTDWENACRANRIESYKLFMVSHPNSEYSSEANKRCQALIQESFIEAKKSFIEAKQAKDIVELEKYVEKYPDSEYVSEANDLIKRMRLLKNELDSGYADVKVGMSESDLVKLLGQPDKTDVSITGSGFAGINAYWYIDYDKDPLYCKYIHVISGMDHKVLQVTRDIGMKK
jgi:hypothetical protein